MCIRRKPRIKLHAMEIPIRCSLVFLSYLVMLSCTGAGLSPTTGAAEATSSAPVRVGVVLDLSSDVGRKRRACVSNALHDFDLEHPSYAKRVELRVMDSHSDLATAKHAADDLIRNALVQAVILGPQTAEHVLHLPPYNHYIPLISFSSTFPTSCTFWLVDSGGHLEFGFTLGSDSITFPSNLKTQKRNGLKLDKGQTTGEVCQGPPLKIGVPLKYGFKEFVDATDPKNITGYSIDIFEAAMRTLQPTPCYDYSIFHGTYDELAGNVSLGVYDAAVGDLTVTVERVNGTDFTVPYTQSGVSMLVLANDDPYTILWTFAKPLSGDLWFATLVFFVYTGFVLCIIERPRNKEYQGPILRQCSTSLYYIFSTLTFSHGHSIRSPLSKIVVVVWCFLVLILVQSYTASLSSMLTAKRLRPWVKDLDQLQRRGDFIGYPDGSFVRSFLMNQKISENRLRTYTTKEEYDQALRLGSSNGGVSAIIDEIPYLTSFISDRRYKNDFRMLGNIYKTPGFGFAFQLGSPFVHNVSIAILNLARVDEGSQIEVKWFGTSSSPVGDGMVPDTDSGPLTFHSFSGLFVITGSISTLMLLISIARVFYAKSIGSSIANVESVGHSNVNEDSRPLQDGMGDNEDPHEQSIHEASNNDADEVHDRVSDENVVGGDPASVPLNDMHIGSVSATHIQIETSNN